MPFNSVPRARSISRRAQFDRSTRAREVLNVDGLQVNVLRKKNRNMYLRVKPPYGAIEVTAPYACRSTQSWSSCANAVPGSTKRCIKWHRLVHGRSHRPTSTPTSAAVARRCCVMRATQVRPGWKHRMRPVVSRGTRSMWSVPAVRSNSNCPIC